MNKIIKTAIFVLLLTVIFAQMIQAAEVTPQDKPSQNEMLVYFIRESNMLGAARRILVTCNENTVASLSSGSYCAFKLTSGPNLIGVVQVKAQLGNYLLKFRPWETVYLSFDYLTGKVIEASQDAGPKMLLRTTKNISLMDPPEPNEGLDFVLMNPGLIGIELMKETAEPLTPDPEHAVITFFRYEKQLKDIQFGIWSESEFLGSIKAYTYCQAKVTPGKHYFIGKSEVFTVLEANVEAGKNYYVEFNCKMGWMLPRVEFIPISKSDSKAQASLDGSTHVIFDKTLVTPEFQTLVMDRAPITIQDVLQKVEKGDIKTKKLNPEDAWF